MTQALSPIAVIPDLAGKAVLITGASTGIGAAAAVAFGQNRAKVAIVYRSSADEAEQVGKAVREAGGEALLIRRDVTEPDAPAAVIAETTAAFGRLDVLINNAGGLIRRTPVEDYDEALQQAVLDLNINHVVRFMREGALTMRAQGGGGAIVNVASIAGRTGGGPGSVLYAAAKGYIATATRGWAKELVKDGIRVNAVSPGVIATPFHDRFSTAEQLAGMRATIPMGRLGEAWECAGAFLFLSSHAMSSYVTGQMLEVNGGQFSP